MTPLPWHIDAVGGVHPIAYWLMLTVRDAIPKTHALATAEFTTIRLRLLKLGARVTRWSRPCGLPLPPRVRTPLLSGTSRQH
jgi:hypothetical protein